MRQPALSPIYKTGCHGKVHGCPINTVGTVGTVGQAAGTADHWPDSDCNAADRRVAGCTPGERVAAGCIGLAAASHTAADLLVGHPMTCCQIAGSHLLHHAQMRSNIIRSYQHSETKSLVMYYSSVSDITRKVVHNAALSI